MDFGGEGVTDKEQQSSEDIFYEAHLRNRSNDILGKAWQITNLLSNQTAFDYFRYGVMIRFKLIMESRNLLFELISKKDGNRIDTTLENIYLNSMYINMIATFDNVAWAFQYEYDLIDGANENNNLKRQIGIYNKEFIMKLKIKDKELYTNLKVYKDWYETLKTFRDPATHRMPLYCPPITISKEKDLDEHKKLNEKFSQMNYNDNPQQYMELLNEVHNIGTFQPIFIVSSEKEKSVYDLRKITNDDYKIFLAVMDIFLMWIEKHELKHRTQVNT